MQRLLLLKVFLLQLHIPRMPGKWELVPQKERPSYLDDLLTRYPCRSFNLGFSYASWEPGLNSAPSAALTF